MNRFICAVTFKPKTSRRIAALDINNSIKGLNIEISFPIEKDYDKRQKNSYYFELANHNAIAVNSGFAGVGGTAYIEPEETEGTEVSDESSDDETDGSGNNVNGGNAYGYADYVVN